MPNGLGPENHRQLDFDNGFAAPLTLALLRSFVNPGSLVDEINSSGIG